MKLFCVFLFYSLFSAAQTITNIKGDTVTVTIPAGQSISIGDPISFSDGSQTVARGTIQKVSGQTATAKIKEGETKAGHQVEFFKVTQAAPTAMPLSPEDRKILERGEIGTVRYVIGGVVAIYPGLGFGHLVQGRWKQRGWVFLAGEGAAAGAMIIGAYSCIFSSILERNPNCDNGFFQAGAILFWGFKIWEVIDAWAIPPSLNERYRLLKSQGLAVSGGFVPTKDGGLLALNLTF